MEEILLKQLHLANRIKEKYIIEITIRDVLEFPIVEQLSEFVQKKVKDNSKKSGSKYCNFYRRRIFLERRRRNDSRKNYFKIPRKRCEIIFE